jgi:glycosyltransferase involved in cell wall biosynthesis
MSPKVALVVDALPGLGGSEKVLLAVAELLPEAPIYTLIYNRPAFRHTALADHRVIPSYIDRLPFTRTHYRSYLPLMPRAVEQFDLDAYDVILSFSYAVAHGVRSRPGQRHLSYTYTPMRYAWRGVHPDGSRRRMPWLVERFFGSFRAWDAAAAARVDAFAAVSGWIGAWVNQAYGRDARVIYPPVEVERFVPQPERAGYFVALSRLVPHKRLDLIVEAFNRLKLPLLVVGTGPEERALRRQAGPGIRLLGFQDDRSVADLLSRARGFICAADEDFGIAVVEAQAAGCPVIAYGKGGALETVLAGQTGVFFEEQSAESLVEAVERFEREAFDPRLARQNAARFSKAQFQREFGGFIAAAGQR